MSTTATANASIVSRVSPWATRAGLIALVACSAVLTKEFQSRNGLPALAGLEQGTALRPADPRDNQPFPLVDPLTVDQEFHTAPAPDEVVDTSIRWFSGRPVRPARTVWMTVTAYSPDERSCPGSADGITASNHSVWANGMKLVAADTRLLPLGSMVSVPGYDAGQVVPVLDRGGAIKGARLDLLYPTHEIARKWGVKRLPVTIWEYADGKPPSDWRKIRDSRG